MRSNNEITKRFKQGESPTSICVSQGPKIDIAAEQAQLSQLEEYLNGFSFDKDLLSILGVKSNSTTNRNNAQNSHRQCRIRICPLSLATSQGHTQIVKKLLQYGANPSAKHITERHTPIEIAIQKHNINLLKILVDKSKHSISKQTLNKSLCLAYQRNFNDGIHYLTNKGAKTIISDPQMLEYFQQDKAGIIQALDSNDQNQAINCINNYQSIFNKNNHKSLERAKHYITLYLAANAQGSNTNTITTDKKWSLYLKAYICEQQERVSNNNNYKSILGYLLGYSASEKLVNAEFLLGLLSQCYNQQTQQFQVEFLKRTYYYQKQGPLNQGRLGKLFDNLFKELTEDPQENRFNALPEIN